MRIDRVITLLTACLPLLALGCIPTEDSGETQASSTESSTADTPTSESGTPTSESGETESGESGESETESGESETESGETESGESETETGGVLGDCDENDEWEDNDLPETAALFEWNGGPYGGVSKDIPDAFLCAEEDDWYRFNISDVEFIFDDGEYYNLHLDAIVEGSSWCGENCEQPFLPADPQNTISVEVLDAETLELLDSSVNDQGRIDLEGYGDAYSHDLLVHVFGPTAEATFSYRLSFELRPYDGEDECEC